jgi:tetratricopeptide (TPR) repeat protein
VNIERIATRELSPEEARKIAQQALDEPELFDALVARWAAEASLHSPAISRPTRRLPWARRARYVAAAAAVVFALFLWRSSSERNQQPVEKAQTIIAKPAILPSLENAGNRPLLLANDLRPARSSAAPVFRGGGAPSRPPQSGGRITALEDGEATVNLGSLDGLAKGTALGPIVITTVFRDHARGNVIAGSPIRVNDRVQVPSSLHIAAVLHQVEALAASGDLNQAHALAQSTLMAGSSGETRMLLERLAALDYQAGAPDAAREHYEAATNNFYAPPAASASEQAATLNSLGALYLLRGDPQSAAKPLNQAASVTGIDPDLRAQILNNLGVMAELNGDLIKARDTYTRAHSQANLTRLRNLKRP